MKWQKASEYIKDCDEMKLVTFKSNGMNFTGWYHSNDNQFEDVLSGKFPIHNIYVLVETPNSEQELQRVDIIELVSLQQEYIEFLSKEYDNVWSLAHAHGFKTSDNIVKRGEHLRGRLKEFQIKFNQWVNDERNASQQAIPNHVNAGNQNQKTGREGEINE